MNSITSHKEIGNRIAQLRKAKGFSQEELAKSVGLSRSVLAQIELGNRGLDVLELQRLAKNLTFSLDNFMLQNVVQDLEVEYTVKKKPSNLQERISVPSLNVEKFKNVLLYILEKCAGKPNVGETVLYKLLYFSDFNYYELYEDHLTGASYLKSNFGPIPKAFDKIINQMVGQEEIQKLKSSFQSKIQMRFLPLTKPDLRILFASETDVIDRVIAQMSDWTSTKITEYTHKDLPLLVTTVGDEINYELSLYRELPYSVRVYLDEND